MTLAGVSSYSYLCLHPTRTVTRLQGSLLSLGCPTDQGRDCRDSLPYQQPPPTWRAVPRGGVLLAGTPKPPRPHMGRGAFVGLVGAASVGVFIEGLSLVLPSLHSGMDVGSHLRLTLEDQGYTAPFPNWGLESLHRSHSCFSMNVLHVRGRPFGLGRPVLVIRGVGQEDLSSPAVSALNCSHAPHV